MQALIKTLPALISLHDSDETRRAVVLALWPSVVGDELKGHSAPTELNDKILNVSIRDAAWKREFEHHASAIVHKLNKAVGRNVVKRIEFKADPEIFRTLKSSVKDQHREDLSAIDPKVFAAAAGIADPVLRNNFLSAVSRCANRGR